MPVFDVDFTRSANETLKKIGINDGCVIGASNPVTFTFCREGSSTLWQYQTLDLDQLAAIQSDEKLPATAYQRISIMEADSAACQQETYESVLDSPTARWLALGLVALSLLLGFRYTHRAIEHRHEDSTTFSDSGLQQLSESMPWLNPKTKALASFGMAAAVAVIYFSCSFS
jgi:hypothetical protein